MYTILSITHLLPYVLLICALSGLIAVIILFFKRKLIDVNIYLLFSIFNFSIFLCGVASLHTGLFIKSPYLYSIFEPFFYLAIPSSFLYIRSILQDRIAFKNYDFIHLIPFLFRLIELLFFYSFQPVAGPIMAHLSPLGSGSIFPFEDVQLPSFAHFHLMLFVSIIYYFFQVRLLIHSYRSFRFKYLVRQASKMEWLFIYLLFNTFLLAIFFANVFIAPAHKGATLEIAIGIYLISILAYVLYRWSTQHVATHPSTTLEPYSEVIPTNDQEENLLGSEVEKIESLQADKRLDYRQRIESFLNNQQAYLKKGYSLKALSEDVNLPHHHVSAVINREFNMNFNDYINQYRIKYIQTIMLQPESSQLTLEGLAWQAGFSSRSTFFRAFTKFTNSTPTEYINNQPLNANQNTPSNP
ncbi:helix-turn-helix domain-containing protein [Tellurirhabdus bombi]|uniref:helix-turn-helix domain-containing protein n=1 Tax=Tellurirhabdus bombi TaxID=2907205 RepID=UPI001F1D7261|nr:helix-turn-helix domain-containing protein [Tellurirhabdus bombi]